jgi:hypothetical protein
MLSKLDNSITYQEIKLLFKTKAINSLLYGAGFILSLLEKKETNKMNSEQFLGLGKKDAQNLADRMNLIFRLIRIGEKEFFTYPEGEGRGDVVCIEMDNLKVTKAVIH